MWYLFFIVGIFVIGALVYKDTMRSRRAKEEYEAQEEERQNTLMQEASQLKLLMEVKRQAELVGDQETVAAVMNKTYDGKMPEELSNGMYSSIFDHLYIVNIAGINYRGNLKAYVGDFNGVLVPEPKNDYDPNAIMIKCEDGKHLGYVPEALTSMIRDAIGQDFQRYRVTGHIFECEDEYDLDEHDHPRKFFTGFINIVF